MSEVKIVPVVASHQGKRRKAERALAELVEAGWAIVAAGATFVVLQRG